MMRDRYAPTDLFALVPQWPLRFEPELAELDRLLADDVLFHQVKADLARRRPQSTPMGRSGTPVEGILRLLVVKHLYGWSDEQTEQFVNDSVVVRQFCRRSLAPVPDATTLLRWANLIQPGTWHRLLDRVTELARSRQVTRGRKLRLDSTVVATDIHHPSDSTLLADSVRVLSRLVRRAKATLDTGAVVAGSLWRERTRAAKRLARRIGATRVHQKEAREQERRALYAGLLTGARASHRQAERVRGLLEQGGAAATDRLRAALDRLVPLVEQVIIHTERRVVHDERVPAGEQVLSLFEPHTAILRRGKARQPTEFGAKVVLDEVAGGLVTRYSLCEGNADDALSLPDGLAHHQRCFGRAPDLLAADRHFYSGENSRLAAAAGVRRVVLPKRGQPGRGAAARERERWCRRGHRFRAGIEGRISVLRRGFGLRRCRYHGPAGLERWVGWGLLAHNLRSISRTVARRRAA